MKGIHLKKKEKEKQLKAVSLPQINGKGPKRKKKEGILSGVSKSVTFPIYVSLLIEIKCLCSPYHAEIFKKWGKNS